MLFRSDQVGSQDSKSPSQDARQDQGQDQPSTPHVEATQVDQGQHTGQDGDSNDQDDQKIPPLSCLTSKPRKKLNSPIMDISKRSVMSFENFQIHNLTRTL